MEEWIQRQLAERQQPVGQPRVMFQQWLHLLFLHWTIDPGIVQKTLPAELLVDTYEGMAWIGIVPFCMRRVRSSVLPSLSTNFLELNLRTYVKDHHGAPGVWFYSLDANQPIAVWMARLFFALPYWHAKMHMEARNEEITYSSQRRACSAPLEFQFRPSADLGEAKIGSLEFFLVERYRLFAVRRRRLLTGRVYHSPYDLRKAVVLNLDKRLFQLDGLPSPGGPASSALYSAGVDVTVYSMKAAS